MAIRPAVPVVLVTGINQDDSREAAEAIGMAAFMLKPLDAPELAREIRAILAGD